MYIYIYIYIYKIYVERQLTNTYGSFILGKGYFFKKSCTSLCRSHC